ncbi:MAG: cell division ATP-binding protein FtsE [Pseudomonadota bacterium]|nr:cell division ATP-binding protein FtsE [Pseudomonadota bacterium]
MVRFENVGMRYGMGPEVLHDVTFEINAGEFRYLVGPSGAGKTSLLRLMYLAHRPSRGLISMFGADVMLARRQELMDLRRGIGVVFQDYRLLAHLSALDNVALPLRVAGAKELQVQEHVSELLAWVGLADHIHALPESLSGGQKQRVAIARAVITRPRLLLADEPTGNLDEALGQRLLRLFEELNRIGTTVVIATHNQNMVARNPHPVMTLGSGELRVDPPIGKAS